MKKLILIIAAVAMMLPSCKKINEAIDDLNNRVTELENTTIPTINEQIANINTSIADLEAADVELKNYITALQTTATELQKSIDATNTKIDEVKVALQSEISTAKADVLAQLEALRTEMTNELSQINSTIATLQAKDTELEGKIAELRTYVDTELSSAKDWAEATFATLEQYTALANEIATIKTQITAINTSIADLEARINEKIANDIAAAVATLNNDIQQKVKDITDAYTSAINTAKSEITAAYTTAIESAISTLESSMQSWVNEQLKGYYTIAEIDALLATLTEEFNNKLNAQKAYLEGLINALSEELKQLITSNSSAIDALRARVSNLENSTLVENANKIAENAAAIAANAQNISNNAQAISANSSNITTNSSKIDECKTDIAKNTTLIAENKSAIEALKSSTDAAIAKNATDIAANAEAIAKNAELIAKNAIAINNNAEAIAQNTADIAQLQQDLATTKTEITEAYKSAIATAISTLDGELRGEIATQVSTINSRIDNEIAAVNTTIDALASRVATLESEVDAIQQQIADILQDIANMKDDIANLMKRIQSVTYIPKYSDGKATIDYHSKRGTLDFQISPKNAIKDLEKVWQSALSFKAVHTQTRAVDFINLPITSFEADANNGTITIEVDGTNLGENFFVEKVTASATLEISDGNNYINSPYINLTANYNIRFADKEVERICIANWDTNFDGKLSYEEAANAYRLFHYFRDNKEISIFNELKFFTNVTEIDAQAFQNCTRLHQITLPDNCISTGEYTFDGCYNLAHITIPDNFKKFGFESFRSCLGLKKISIPNIGTWCDIEFVSDNSNPLYYARNLYLNEELVTDVVIPDNITIINDMAFSRCASIVNVIIPNSVLSIGYDAFYSSSLSNVTIGEGVTSIGYNAFHSCLIAKVTLPQSISSIGDFAFTGCSKLKEIYCKATTPPSGGPNMFSSNALGRRIYVPKESVEAYKTAEYWSEYASDIVGYDFE